MTPTEERVLSYWETVLALNYIKSKLFIFKIYMFYLNTLFLADFIKIFLLLYYKNFNNFSLLIYLNYKFILLFNYLILTCYYNYNRNFLLKNFIITDKNNKFNFKIESKILNIKLIAKTTKNIIVRRFYIISVIGNKSNWVGVGVSKHRNLDRAVKNSYRNAFTNITYFPAKILNLIYLNIKFKKTKLIIHKYNFINTNKINLYNIFNLIGFLIKSKIIGVSSNISNLLYIINKLGSVNVS